jgi:hypothetical protein
MKTPSPCTFQWHFVGGVGASSSLCQTAPPYQPNRLDVLVKALARAFRWRKLLDDGTYSTIKEIAAEEKIDPSYVGDVLRLTLFAPDIVEMILDGRQPPTLQFEALRKFLPVLWEEQRGAIRGEG